MSELISNHNKGAFLAAIFRDMGRQAGQIERARQERARGIEPSRPHNMTRRQWEQIKQLFMAQLAGLPDPTPQPQPGP